MRNHVLLTLVALLGLGCGSDKVDEEEPSPTPEPLGPCAKPTGFFEQTYTVDSGNCGPISSDVVDLDNGGAQIGVVNSSCQGNGSASADNCTYQVELTCPSTPTNLEQFQIDAYGGTPPTTHLTASTTWNRPADHATGLWAFTRTSPVAGCSGTYVVELAKL